MAHKLVEPLLPFYEFLCVFVGCLQTSQGEILCDLLSGYIDIVVKNVIYLL